MPDIRHRNRQIFCERALPINTYALCIRAKMPPACQTIPTVSADNMACTRDQISWRKAAHAIADTINNTDKFVTDDHRDRNCFLRPGVPIVNVNVGSADGRFQDSNQYVVTAD